MNNPIRVAIVDDDLRLHEVLRRYVRAPEFDLHAFEDPYLGLMRLHDVAPHVILCDLVMPGLDGWTLYRAVKTSPKLCRVPFILFSAHPVEEGDLAQLSAGDVVLRKPFSLPALTERLRAAGARAAATPSAEPAEPEDGLLPKDQSGVVTRPGLLALLRFCEDAALTGRFRVESAGTSRWVEFVNGEFVRAGATPEEPGHDPLERLLTTESGTYWIERRPVKAEPFEANPSEHPSGLETPPRMPIGRFSIVDSAGGQVVVQTEAEHAPNFTVCTVVVRQGQALRKIESCWPHPLKRDPDYVLARQHIAEQHERILALVREGSAEISPRRAVWAFEGKGVEGRLLCWAISFVGEQVRETLGRVATLAVLRQTLAALSQVRSSLLYFQLDTDGRVVIEEPKLAARTTISGRRLPQDAVESVALWTAAFLNEATRLDPETSKVSVRNTTRMMRTELEEMGFYRAYDEAWEATQAARAGQRSGTGSEGS
jgi:CheY-like chemotaxis protein